MINQTPDLTYNQALINAQNNNLIANQIAYDQAIMQKAAQDQALLQMMQTRNMMAQQPVMQNPTGMTPFQVGNPLSNQNAAKPDDSCSKCTVIIMSIAIIIGGIYLYMSITNSQMWQLLQQLAPYASDIEDVPYVDTCGPFITYNFEVIYFSYATVILGVIGFLLYFRMPLATAILGAVYAGVNYYFNGQANNGDCAEYWSDIQTVLDDTGVQCPQSISFYYNDMFYAGCVYSVIVFIASRMK